MTSPEADRPLARAVWTPHHHADSVLAGSLWRRRHQARARGYHYIRPQSPVTSTVRHQNLPP